MLTREQLAWYNAEMPAAAPLLQHILELEQEMEERSKRTTSIHNAWREQDTALAEAREFVELTATLTPCTPSQYMRAQTWVKIYDATHRAPKETP